MNKIPSEITRTIAATLLAAVLHVAGAKLRLPGAIAPAVAAAAEVLAATALLVQRRTGLQMAVFLLWLALAMCLLVPLLPLLSIATGIIYVYPWALWVPALLFVPLLPLGFAIRRLSGQSPREWYGLASPHARLFPRGVIITLTVAASFILLTPILVLKLVPPPSVVLLREEPQAMRAEREAARAPHFADPTNMIRLVEMAVPNDQQLLRPADLFIIRVVLATRLAFPHKLTIISDPPLDTFVPPPTGIAAECGGNRAYHLMKLHTGWWQVSALPGRAIPPPAHPPR